MKLHLTAIALLGLATLLTAGMDAASPPPVSSGTRAAAESGDPDACFQLARAHLTGKGAPRDAGMAFQFMKKAADRGHADAMGGLGYFYMKGLGGVEKDPREAMNRFRIGAEKGSAKSQLNLGICLLDDTPDGADHAPEEIARRHLEGLDWLRKAAAQGLAEAELTLGRYYYSGEHGLSVDYQQAARMLEAAALQGSAEARNILGTMKENGIGSEADAAAAVRWYRMAAMQGHVRAQSNLGRALSAESSDPARRIEALAWLRLAADQGNVMAQKSLDDVKSGIPAADFDEARKMTLELRRKISASSR